MVELRALCVGNPKRRGGVIYSAVLDACVLVPSNLRHVLLRVAVEGVYRPLWSDRIWAETRTAVAERALAAADGTVMLGVFDAIAPRIRSQFDDAMVTGWEALEPAMGNHPKDRHVLAAAVAGRADAIVSDDTTGFAPAALAPFGIEAQTADGFLLNQLDLAPAAVARAVEACAATTGKADRPRLGPKEWLLLLDRSAPAFATEARLLW